MTISTMNAQPYMSPITVRRSFPAIFRSSTWREFGYLSLVGLLIAPFALTYAVLVPALSAGFLITVVGLFVGGGLVVGARGWGRMYRGLADHLLDEYVPEPPTFVAPKGFWRKLAAMLFDPTGWRAILFMFASFVIGITFWVISFTFLMVGVGGVTYPLWWRWLPLQTMADGTRHRGFSITNGDWYWFADRPSRIFIVILLGVAFFALWPILNRGFTNAFRGLSRALLGPTAGSIRTAQLRRQRAAVVEDSDVRLRRIERDLHDGTQTQLTVLAMQLGEARELLNEGGDPALAAQLLGSAESTARDAMVDLRDIARGIHLPSLDMGLASALASLKSRSAIPVRLDVAPDVDLIHAADGRVGGEALTPAIRSIAYYSTSELINNAAKYSGANEVTGQVTKPKPHWLRIAVSDNGRGGARVIPPGERVSTIHGTGLAGIKDRVEAVDGKLSLTSPLGGPTQVEILLPVTPA
jgi:signal transduction histidine kinase